MKRMRRLDENLTADVVLAGRDPSAMFEQLMQQWSDAPNAELSIVLTIAQAVAMLHQTHHWISRGTAYFSDHKLFEQLYVQLAEDVDTIAERAVGLGADVNVDLHRRLAAMQRFIGAMYAPSGVPTPDAIAERSLAAEYALARIITMAIASMRSLGSLTAGVENMLEQFHDGRERAIYHLRRRTTSAA